MRFAIRRAAAAGLLALPLAAPAAAQDLELLSQPSRWRFSLESVDNPEGRDIGMLGVHYDLLESDSFLPGLFFGLGGYGAVTGDEGGFLTGGFSLGMRHGIGAGLTGELGAFLGAGGGGGAPQGSGLMLRPWAAIEMPFAQLPNAPLRLELSHVTFPSGELGGTTVALGWTVPSELLVGSSGPRGARHVPPGAVETRGFSFAPLFARVRPGDGSRTLGGQVLGGTLEMGGVEVRSQGSNGLWTTIELWGATGGGIGGFAAVLMGLGVSLPLIVDGLSWELELLVGSGGGGDVDTGGGFLWKPAAGLRWDLGSGWAAQASVSRWDAPDGHFTATGVEAGLAWQPQAIKLASAYDRERLAEERLAAELAREASWRPTVLHKTYWPTSDAIPVSGGAHDAQIHLMGIGLSHAIDDHVRVLGRAYGAYSGGAGGYAEGLIGFEAGIQPIRGAPDHRLSMTYEIGAGGGGGVDTGSALIHQLTAAWTWNPAGNLHADLGVGWMEPVGRGSFEAGVLQIGVGWDLGMPVAR